MPLDGVLAVRVVPSGQIYRQLFDAQLQLHRSLSHFDSESRIQRLKSKNLSDSNGLPLVRLKYDEIQHGILNDRQKTWVEGFPNDPYTENPVLYKQYNEYLNQKLQDEKPPQAGWEVRSLPDIVVSAKKESNIIERVVASKRERHESTLEDMHQELSLISMEIEPLIEELTADLLGKLAVSDKEIADFQAEMEKDEDLLRYQLPDMCEIWEKIHAHAMQRQGWIDDMNSNLQKMEKDRINKIREIFSNYGDKLKNISYLLLPDLQRLLDKESQLINQTVLSNHRSYADLYVRLICADVERERIQHSIFLRRVEDWKIIKTRMTIEDFKEFMEAEAIVQPVAIEIMKTKLMSDLDTINSQRLEIIKTLSDMKPPISTRSAVARCRHDLNKLSQELDAVMQIHMTKLHKEYENVCQQCLARIDSTKLAMIQSGICSRHKANQMIDEFMLPLVGKQQRVFENNLEYMQKITEEHTARLEEEIKRMLKFAHAAAEMWDMHEIALTKQEKELQEQLDTSRQQHDRIIQEQEANLDIVMDRMRQDGNEMDLKDSLLKALTMLTKIKDSYEEFHGLQTQIVQMYPKMVKVQLNSYYDDVYHYFSVSRVTKAVNKASEVHHKIDEPESQMNETEEISMNDNIVDGSEVQSRPKEPQTPTSENERLLTPKGTEYYVEQKDIEWSLNDNEEEEATFNMEEEIFFTEVKDLDKSFEDYSINMPDFIQAMDIPRALMVEAEVAIRMRFLEHLDDWSQQATLRANSVVAAKCEELNNELDLKLHLHQPRSHRTELDVHNVRAAELVMHAERIKRHCSGMEQSLAELGNKFKAMSQEHNSLANKFKKGIEAFEEIVVNATKAARLVKLQNQVKVELDKYMSVIRTSLRQFRHHLDKTLQTLRESNARFIKSFKLFSEGGNFCPEEVTIYRKTLEKMSLMIDSTEGSVMSDLEGMESKHLESATAIAADFEDRFKGHMSDLVFMESIAHWLTNTQVKIKAEVAKCNTQAQGLSQRLHDLQSKVSAHVKPNFDKEQVSASQINDTVPTIFNAFIKHSEYLHSMQTGSRAADKTAAGAKNFTIDLKLSKGLEDTSVAIIKSIFKAQASRKGTDNKLNGDDTEPEKNKTQMSQLGKTDSDKMNVKGPDNIKEVTTKKSISGRISKSVRAVDRRSDIFGEKFDSQTEGDQDKKYFLSTIQSVLKEAMNGLLTTAEVFYQQKGTRSVTRPQVVPETLDQCSDIMSHKLQSYYNQTTEYYNKCLHEFRGQLMKLEELCASIPSLVTADFLKGEIQRSTDSQNKISKEFHITLSKLIEKRKSIEKELRPTLGHPQHANDLVALHTRGKEHHEEFLEVVKRHIKERQECALEHAKAFLGKLVRLAELQLQQYDNMLIIDDVTDGQAEPISHSTCELIRYMKAEKVPSAEAATISAPRGKSSWLGIPSNQFVVGERPDTLEVTPTMHSQKTTMAHNATIKTRNKAYADYKAYFGKSLQEIEEIREKIITSQTSWDHSWESSVAKVKNLYQKE